jgi:hypothetical protein
MRKEIIMKTETNSNNSFDLDRKPWWRSVGVWGNIIAILATGGGFFGCVLTPEDQQIAASVALHGADFVVGAIALLGEIAGLWGRLRASRRIA